MMKSNRCSQNTDGKFLVRYKNETFDLTNFVHKHPGGKNTLTSMLDSDIDFKFDKVMPHSDAAKYLINEYKISNQTNNNDNKCNCNLIVDNNKIDKLKDNHNKNIKNNNHQCTFNKNGQAACDSYEHLVRTDESMEVNK